MKKLRDDQKKAVKACARAERGQIISPTGTGKSVEAMDLIRRMVKSKKRTTDEPFVAVSFVHRILLAKQWMGDACRTLMDDHHLPFNFVNINSGGVSSKIQSEVSSAWYKNHGPGVLAVVSTTTPDDVRKAVDNLLKRGSNVLICCTYHSAESLLNSGVEVDLAIFDEAQVLTRQTFREPSLSVPAAKRIFFTATPSRTASDDGAGMNNTEIYGEVLFELSPVEAINMGAIVKPRIDLVGAKWELKQRNSGELGDQDWDSLTEIIFFSHAQHKAVIQAESADKTKLGAKLLVVCNGQEELKGIFRSIRSMGLRQKYPNIHLFGLCTEFGVNMNGVQYRKPVTNARKDALLQALKDVGESEDAIIFHVDMLSEGIDVPSITGMMPLKYFSEDGPKFLQNLGRASRLHPLDRERIENGTLTPCDWANYIKPHCYVVLSACKENHRDFLENYATEIDDLRTLYDFDPRYDVNVNVPKPAQTPPAWDDQFNRDSRSNIRDDINELYYTCEQESLDVQEILARHRFSKFVTEDDPTSLIEAMGKLM